MSTIETILTRAMIDPEFANQLFTNPNRTLAAYNLSAQEIALIKSMPRTEFTTHAVEARKSFAMFGRTESAGSSGGMNHNQIILKVK